MARWSRAALAVAAVVILAGCRGDEQASGEVATSTSIPTATVAVGSQATDPASLNETLITDLRGGGFFIYIRHTSTDRSREDTDGPELEQCELQRPLDEGGRADAVRLGEAIRALEIPVGDVLASPFCRTKDTAALAFGDYEVEPELRWYGDGNYLERVAWLEDLLSGAAPVGNNTVLVSHSANLSDLAQVMLNEGESAIIEVRGGAFRVVARVLPGEWHSWAERLGEVSAR